MLVEVKEIRMIRRAIANMKPEWRVRYKNWGNELVTWIHADDEAGVYAELLRRHAPLRT
jgi:hypothetical protein